ncbi:MAG: hypothetical protein AAFX78_03570 [Cyanobacteria bacterium J06638_20]
MVAEIGFTGELNLDQYVSRLKDLGPALDKIGLYTERRTGQAIAAGKKLSGQPLAPLAPLTKAEKQFRGKASGVLRRDGGLLADLRSTRPRSNEVQVGWSLEYAPWVILGTRPYKIRPKASSTLRFYTDDGWRSSSEINHPGLPERNVFEGAAQAISPYAIQVIQEHIDSGR